MDINTNGAGSAAGSTKVMCSASNKKLVEARDGMVGQSGVVVISRREYERLEKLEERVKNLEKELEGRDARISKVESGVCEVKKGVDEAKRGVYEAKRGVDEAKRGVDEAKEELRRTHVGLMCGLYK